ncbi:hypothetical protein MASR2M78_16740 [Treponema sp.]
MKIEGAGSRANDFERGYPDVAVRTETRTLPNSSISLRFIIDEGEQLSIESFRLSDLQLLLSELSLFYFQNKGA